jgi:hypothetical protein
LQALLLGRAQKPHIHYPTTFYHAILHGNGGQDIFFDRQTFLQMVSSYSEPQFLLQANMHHFSSTLSASMPEMTSNSS